MRPKIRGKISINTRAERGAWMTDSSLPLKLDLRELECRYDRVIKGGEQKEDKCERNNQKESIRSFKKKKTHQNVLNAQNIRCYLHTFSP